MNIEQINDFLDGPVSRKFAGRKRIHDDLTCDTLVHMTTSRVKDRLNKVLTDFALFYAENINVKPSTSFLSRLLCKNLISRKVIETRHILKNYQEQYEYITRIAKINPWDLINMDGICMNEKEFYEKYGWSPIGKQAVHYQIKIGTKTYGILG